MYETDAPRRFPRLAVEELGRRAYELPKLLRRVATERTLVRNSPRPSVSSVDALVDSPVGAQFAGLAADGPALGNRPVRQGGPMLEHGGDA
jgi:hypothetical protein